MLSADTQSREVFVIVAIVNFAPAVLLPSWRILSQIISAYDLVGLATTNLLVRAAKMGREFLPEMWDNRLLPTRSLGESYWNRRGHFRSANVFFDIGGEVFTKSKAHFVGDIRAGGHFETFPGYEPKIREEQRLKGSD